MTFPIHDAGGLTEAEIKLAIEESAERRESTLDRKLEAHRDELNGRLERTDDKVIDSLTRIADLQATVAVVSVETARQTELLQSIQAQGQQWHTDDLAFRNDVLTRVGNIETQQTVLTEQARRLHWLGVVLYGCGKTTRFCLDKLLEADIWKLIVVAVVLFVLKLVSPVLYHLLAGLVSK